jgi:hypothetical protein
MNPVIQYHAMPITPQTIPPGSVLQMQARVGFFSVPHPGVLDYTNLGEAVVIHNSKRHGRVVVTSVAEFAEGQQPVLVRPPSSPGEGFWILQRAYADVERHTPWLPWDNCQNLVNRAVSGEDRSETWGAVVGVLCCVGIGVAIAKS